MRLVINGMRREPDGACRLELVTSQHPYLDAGLTEARQRLWHAILQAVLDCSGAEQRHALLDGCGYYVQRGLTPFKLLRGAFPGGPEAGVPAGGEGCVSNAEVWAWII